MSDPRPNFWEYWGKYCPRCKNNGRIISEQPCYSCGIKGMPAAEIGEDGYLDFSTPPDPTLLKTPTKFQAR